MKDSKQNSLTSLTMLYMVGNFSSKVLSFALVFFMTYFLTKEEIGEYDLILTSVAFIVPVVSLQIDSALLRWLLDQNSKINNEHIFDNVFGLIVRNVFVYSILYWTAAFFIEWNYKVLVYVFSVLMVVFPTLQQGLRGIGKSRMYAYTSVVYSFFFVVNTFVALYLFNATIKGVLIANIIALFIVVLWLLRANRWFRHIKLKRIDINLIKDLCRYSLPLLPNTLSWWLIAASTRYVILGFLGKEYNGLFAISYKVPTIVLVMTNVFVLAWQEKIIRIVDEVEVEKTFSLILSKYIGLVLGFALIIVSCSKFLMQFLGEEYFESWKYIPILLYAVFLQAIAAFYGAGYLRTKKTKAILSSSILGGIITVAFSLLLVKEMGLYGVSVSILLGYLAMFIFRSFHLREFLKVRFPILKTIMLSVLYIALAGFLYIDQYWVFPVSLVVSTTVFIAVNYNFIKSTILKLKSKWKK